MGKPPASRLKLRNTAKILDAAQHVFAVYGYHGATIDKVTERAGMSQPNLHNYFKTKADLYAAVLDQTLSLWLELIDDLDAAGDPFTELRRYIGQKMELSRQFPEASRVFANEILQGAPVLKSLIRTRVRTNVRHFAEVVEGWAAAGKIRVVDPYHLVFLIWSATQHYADFGAQIRAIMDVPKLTRAHFAAAEASISEIILHGLAI
ncbi:MAG: TetR family transcriptional regulator C-terminal domain-containing protein [Asticcacaulis sp.]|nr:TetR family transcriptional regulator C-terminal domain-containing protein [Asticcacaulis sp.]